jgi:hypothetical protein
VGRPIVPGSFRIDDAAPFFPFPDGLSTMSPYTARAQALGSFIATLALGVLAIVLGISHHEAWVVVPAIIGIAGSASLVASCTRWYRREGRSRDGVFPGWWRRWGVWMLVLIGIPTWVAVAGMAIGLQRHR